MQTWYRWLARPWCRAVTSRVTKAPVEKGRAVIVVKSGNFQWERDRASWDEGEGGVRGESVKPGAE